MRFLTPSPRRCAANYRQSDIQAVRDILYEMYLVLPDYLNTVTNKKTPPPLPQSPNTEKPGKKHNSNKRLRSVQKIKTKKKKKYISQRDHDMWVAKRSAARRGSDYDKWFKVRGKFHEADIERKNQIKI